jgi:hypothetical protein
MLSHTFFGGMREHLFQQSNLSIKLAAPLCFLLALPIPIQNTHPQEIYFFKGLRLLVGDQVMFCRRTDFWDCGGFDEALPIMEDGDLCLRLLQKGRIWMVNRIVHSSDRRVARWGVPKAIAIYVYIGILWGIGVDANYLKQFYQDIR